MYNRSVGNFSQFANNMKQELKENGGVRHFSADFKRGKIRLLEAGKLRVCDLVKVYGVSRSAVYKWKAKYGSLPKGERIVVEKESEEARTLELLNRVKELEAALGRKDLENTYLRTVLKEANNHFGCDVEKKLGKP